VVASILEPSELESMHQRLKQLPDPPARARPSGDDWRGTVSVFLTLFLASFPVVIPFIFMNNAVLALRVSHGIAIALLFGAGYVYGRLTGGHPWALGILMVLLGALLVGLTIALGG
jgi:VIT1/CCC1 family predicted Fe2+/Mn2+ transporter